MALDNFIKYPKTIHIGGAVDNRSDLSSIIQSGQLMIVEEKMDGTQVGISLSEQGQFQIQSRGQFVTSETEFSLLKSWCWESYAELSDLLGQRYILFGEWLYAKHTMFYDQLPNYFLEFDIFDRQTSRFISTKSRRILLKPFSFIYSVNVIDTSDGRSLDRLEKMIGRSSFTSKTAFQTLTETERGNTDTTGSMEGLYIKIESENEVVGRYKFIRPEFIDKIVSSGTHWKSRSLTKNLIAEQY